MVFDIELGKQLAMTHFISSPCFGELVVRAVKILVSCKAQTLCMICAWQIIILLNLFII